MSELNESALVVGGRYNWKNQPERLRYLGLCPPRNGRWHQFAKVGESEVWCEVLPADLRMLEKTAKSDPLEELHDLLYTAQRFEGERRMEAIGRARVVLHELREAPAKPMDMILYCPSCGTQHIDKPDPQEYGGMTDEKGFHPRWDNPPHRSHQCQKCEFEWRPSDSPTNGVERIATAGQNDSLPVWPVATPAAVAPSRLLEYHELAAIIAPIVARTADKRDAAHYSADAVQRVLLGLPVPVSVGITKEEYLGYGFGPSVTRADGSDVNDKCPTCYRPKWYCGCDKSDI